MKLDLQGYIKVPGGNVWYGVYGADKKAAPILVLHGGPGATHDYLEPLAELADERPVIFYDQLGAGNSDKPSDKSLWTVGRFSRELACVRTALGINDFHLLGQSWGTMLAVDYALRNPKGIKSLILSAPCISASRFITDTRAYLSDLPEDMRKTIADCEAGGSYDGKEYQDAMTAFYHMHMCRMDPWPECLLKTIKGMSQAVYTHMWGPSEFTLTGTLKNFERAEHLGKIAVPALFTAGRYDEATPEAAEYYSQKLPGSKAVIFEDASHQHHLEKREEYLRVVREFVGR
ncbi:MAG: proline iminopeptidase-family hydrolase [Candidatus Omnitrophica bacterium]|nr:proline iminopeptidase-family hydrolase [Candidatus Omnitrophota bacterium]